MPPVIVAIAAGAAYVGGAWAAAAIGASALVASMVGSIVAYGVGAAGNAIFGLGQREALNPLDAPDVFLANESSNSAALPVVYGARRMGGNPVFVEVNGTGDDANRFLDVVYSICEGPIDEIGTMYFNGEAVAELDEPGDVETEEIVLTFNGMLRDWVDITFKVAHDTTITGNKTDDWADLLAWAAGTYTGELELDRSPLDDERDQEQGPYTYTVAATPRDREPGLGGQIQFRAAATIEPLDDDDAFVVVSVREAPTLENDWTARVRVETAGTGGAGTVSLTLFARIYTPGDHNGYVECYRHLGAADQVADVALVSRSANWNADCRGAGVAYCYVRFIYSPNAWPRGVPVVTWDIRGRTVYDPDTSTTAWSENPALCIRDYLTNTLYGRGLAESEIDDQSIIDAAAYCAEYMDPELRRRRYTCNGAVATNRSARENLEALLGSCRGWLPRAGGIYRLLLDGPSAPVMTFNEANIVGEWSIDLGENTRIANRVNAVFFSRALAWESNTVTVDSEELRETNDNGVLIERTLQLEFTADSGTARALALLTLNQSRQSILATFTAKPEGLRCLAGDVVAITHPRPGWSGKLFRIARLDLLPSGLVGVMAFEYAAAVYTADEVLIEDPAENTNLPSPIFVAPPGMATVTEQLYSTRPGAGVKSKLVVSWGASEDAYVVAYRLEVFGPLDTAWRAETTTPAGQLGAEILDAPPGLWKFRVIAINAIGVESEPSTVVSFQAAGLLAPPANVSELTGAGLSGMVILTWATHPDLDVRIGGTIRVRVYTGPGVAAWDNGQEVGTVPGSAITMSAPLVSGWYMAKAVDSSGVESITATTIYVDVADFVEWVDEATWSPAPTWAGTFTGTEVVGSALQLEETAGQVDALTGSWESSTVVDIGRVAVVRLRGGLECAIADLAATIDARPEPIDLWPDFDGLVVSAAAIAQIWVAWSDAGVAYESWQRLTAADIESRFFKFKITLGTERLTYNIIVSSAVVTIKTAAPAGGGPFTDIDGGTPSTVYEGGSTLDGGAI